MKKIIVLLSMIFATLTMMAQADSVYKQNKYEAFESKTGYILKYVEKSIKKKFQLDEFYTAKCKIKTVYGNDKNYYFLFIQTGQNSTHIEYSDLIEINKAFEKLLSEVTADSETSPEYLYNYFTSVDDFKIGYKIEKSKVKWSVKYRYNSWTYNILKPEEFAKYLKEMQQEIEMLIVNNGK